MMRILIKQITIIDPPSDLNRKVVDILVEDGIIKTIAPSLTADNVEVLEGEGLYLSRGWMDTRVNFRDPGQEYKEDLLSGCEAAAYGGFTQVALLPDTEPAVSTKSLITYIKNRTAHHIVDVHPMATVYQPEDESSLSEMHDLANAGAIAFTTGYKAVPDDNFLMRAMLYSKNVRRPLVIFLHHKTLAGKAMMNEGEVNVQLGLKGAPAIAEEIELYRILAMVRYTGAEVHISGISTAKSLALLQEFNDFRENPATAEIYGSHLFYEESDLLEFDTNLKLRPPLRTREDRDFLRSHFVSNYACLGITSDHNPHEEDVKRCEFEVAAHGCAGTQTLFSQLLDIYGEAKLEEIIFPLAIWPAFHFRNMDLQSAIQEGKPANLTIFSTTENWTLNAGTNKSRSRNTPMWGKELKGRAVAIFNKGQFKRLQF